MSVLSAAAAIDARGAKGARAEIAVAKVLVPSTVQEIVDAAI